MAELPASSGATTGQEFRNLAELARLQGHQQVIARTDTGITTVADLAGRNVGLLMGSSSQYELQLAMESVGLNSDVVT